MTDLSTESRPVIIIIIFILYLLYIYIYIIIIYDDGLVYIDFYLIGKYQDYEQSLYSPGPLSDKWKRSESETLGWDNHTV